MTVIIRKVARYLWHVATLPDLEQWKPRWLFVFGAELQLHHCLTPPVHTLLLKCYTTLRSLCMVIQVLTEALHCLLCWFCTQGSWCCSTTNNISSGLYTKHISSGANLNCSMQRTPCYIWHAENSAQCQRAETQSTHVTELVCQLMACQNVFFSAVVGRCWGKGQAVA